MKAKRSTGCLASSIIIFLISCLSLASILLTGIGLGQFNLKVGRVQPASTVSIRIMPVGSEVHIDGMMAGITPLDLHLAPGKHTIRVERINHIPYEVIIKINSDEQRTLEYHLTFQPYVELVYHAAKMPFWDTNGSLLFLSMTDGTIYRQTLTGEQEPLVQMPGYTLTLAYSSDGEYLLADTIPGIYPELSLISLADNVITPVGMSTSDPIWTEDGRFFFLGWLSKDLENGIADYQLWVGQPNNNFYSIELPEIGRVLSANSIGFGWSSDGQWFLVQSDAELNLWQFADNKFYYAHRVAPAFIALWAPAGGAHLAYVDGNGALYYLPKPENPVPQLLANSVRFPLCWMPEGKRLIFTTYDTTEGSSAFWAVDVETGNRTLLADSSMILGRVVDFAISPDGLKIAYVNDLEQLWILVLGE